MPRTSENLIEGQHSCPRPSGAAKEQVSKKDMMPSSGDGSPIPPIGSITTFTLAAFGRHADVHNSICSLQYWYRDHYECAKCVNEYYHEVGYWGVNECYHEPWGNFCIFQIEYWYLKLLIRYLKLLIRFSFGKITWLKSIFIYIFSLNTNEGQLGGVWNN